MLTADGIRGTWARISGEAEPPPAGVAQRFGERLHVDIAEQADQRVGGEHKQREVEDRAPRDAAKLDQILIAGVQRRAHPLAHVFQLDVGRLEHVVQLWRHRRFLDVRQRGDELLVAERVARSRRD